MFFCPFCGSLLHIGKQPDLYHYFCSACTYVIPVTQTLTRSHSFLHENKKKPEDEDIFRSAAADGSVEGSQITTIRCASSDASSEVCPGEKAYYIQVQMRSADEPPTTFFKCITCGFQWKSD